MMADVKALEHPTLKVPYEILNKKFRAAQKQLDREVSQLQSLASELEGEPRRAGQLQTIVGNLLEKLEQLRAADGLNEELEAAAACKRRIEHLKGFEAGEPWKRQRLDRLLAEHLLRWGYYGTAGKLVERGGLRDLTNLDLFLVSKEVEDSLAARDTARCLAWCHEHRSKLRKLRSSLEFQLRQQEFIELVRRGERLEAVRHARRHLAPLAAAAGEGAQGSQLADVQRAMGLLAFPTAQRAPYPDLLADARWEQLVQQFRQEHLRLYQLSSCSVFSVALQAGLSALKTPQCYDEAQRNPDCPVCSRALNGLARGLPYAHCSQSRLVCRISGHPLNEHNQPLVLPNGYVYGEQALRSSSRRGRVTCPRTRETFDLKDAEKVYVM
ncbi:E3 ubiquitin-protein transferase MAEA-like [Ornithodoros turicata]|uniref:E3 ubiquitin-protein transferase MAEA-like n=1 Tax=Ornithodoros turicata TaxID=34597 RepID=UPI003139BA74